MKIKNFLNTLFIAAIGAGIAIAGSYYFLGKEKVYVPVYENATKFTGTKTNTEINFSDVAEHAVHAVVHVKTFVDSQTMYNPLLDFFYGQNETQQPNTPAQLGAGSGVIVSPNGYIVTNNHVIEHATQIEITLNDRRTYQATLVGSDPTTDIALLKIDATDLPVLALGNSDELKIGEWVLAVGNPFNLTSTVTAGIVSAKARNINLLNKRYAIESFIQTDAAVNPGNSGGALVNTAGELIGINTAIASHTGSFTGYSFAVPVNIVGKIVKDLKEFGTAQRAVLGVNIRNLDANLAKELDVENLEGVQIVNVQKNGSADQAGIQVNDIILSLGDKKTNNIASLQEAISKYRPGDKVIAQVNRNNKVETFEITFQNRQGTTSLVENNVQTVLGAKFEPVSEREKSLLRIANGLKITELQQGKLQKSGIQEGFIIVFANHKPVNSAEDLENLLNSAKGGIFLEGIYPNGIKAYYAFGMQ